MNRAFDVAFSLAALAIASPIIALGALAKWLEDFHSPFYLGSRVAKGGGTFRMVKLRSMSPEAWRTGVSSTSNTDRRITRVGAILRRYKLDELPQFWNVLTGDMSLVGPRPQVESEAATYTDEERRMLSIQPGITDLASIVFADEGDILSGSLTPDLMYNQVIRPWKSRLALVYIDHRSFAVDLEILWLTSVSLLDRVRALHGVARILERWNADETVRRMARRLEPLRASPPPGAQEIAGGVEDLASATAAGDGANR